MLLLLLPEKIWFEKLNLLNIGEDFFEGLFDTFAELLSVNLLVVVLSRRDCDIVFWKGWFSKTFFRPFSRRLFFAEAISGDSNVVELGLGHDGYTGMDVDTERNISNLALKFLTNLFLDYKDSVTYSPCIATSGEVTQISLRRGMVDFLDYQR